MKIPVIAQDKANHFVYGAVIGLVAALVARLARAQPLSVLIFTVATVAVVATLTELRQRQLSKAAVARGEPPTHDLDPMDVVWTVFGGATVGVAAAL